MKLQNDDDDYGRSSLRLPTVILIASAAIFAVLAVVLVANNKLNTHKNYYKQEAAISQNSADSEYTDTLTAQDLDFWDMYQNGDTVDVPSSGYGSGLSRKDELEQRESEMNAEEQKAEDERKEEEDADKDPNDDGKHTLVTHIDGTTEWLTINSSLKLNTYEDTNFESQNGKVGYYVNNKKTTKTGVDISQYTTGITWSTLASEADYVMIRVGARGYDTGSIIADTKFIENVQNAVKYNIPFGLYFSSQATTEEEAREEATYVLNQIAAAKTAVETLSSDTSTQTTTSSSTASNTAITSTPTNLVMSLPVISASLTSTASDNDGNTTKMYSDGTAVTTYSSGTIVTAYSNGSMITNYTDGSVEKKDTAGNVINIDAKGNYTIKNSSGVQTASGTTTVTSSLANTTQNTSGTVSANSSTGSTASGYTFKLSYPVAVEMHLVANDTSRIEKLSTADRTTMIKTFCDQIKTSGYTPMVRGDKEMLLTKLNLAILNAYDIWICNDGDVPDYPYLMTMWRYNSDDDLMGSLSGDYGVDVCFVDYSAR